MARVVAKATLPNLKIPLQYETKPIKSRSPPGYWEKKENIHNFLGEIKEKYNLNTPEDWNSIKKTHITLNGGRTLLIKYTMFELKCMACPEGKSMFNNPKHSSGYWENQENIQNFLSKIKEKYNLKTVEDWNSITTNHIKSNGGKRLLANYSIYELKCMAHPEGKSKYNKPSNLSGYWEKKENIHNFLTEIKEKYSLNTPEDWNSITKNHITLNGGSSLLHKYSVFELKCMACPEGKSLFDCQQKTSGYWENQENIDNFLLKIKEKYKLNTIEDWNSITKNHIKSNGGRRLVSKYSMFEIKCMACPEGKSSFYNPKQPFRYWEKQENIDNFLLQIKEKYNLKTPEDWNSITKKLIESNGGSSLLHKYSIFEIKCMACPEGKASYNKPKHSSEFWENEENVLKFLSEIKEKYNFHTPKDWNSLTKNIIISNGGSALLHKYTIVELKCLACPECDSTYNKRYWENKENILQFLSKIKEMYGFTTPEDWNSLTREHIGINGGSFLLQKYSIFDLKCMACPEGKSSFNRSKLPSGYWENRENIENFLLKIKGRYNLNSPEDWNSITKNIIRSNGGSALLQKYSLFEIKCMACPEGESMFDNQPKPTGYWEKKENVLQFLSEIKQKYLFTTPEDWNSLTKEHIEPNGGSSLLSKYSIFDLKCMACPEGKYSFSRSKLPAGHWESKDNIEKFLSQIKEKYDLNTPDDWNSIKKSTIRSNGGGSLLHKYSMFELKCMACPEGESMFDGQPKPAGYWENHENIDDFLDTVKEKYNLKTLEDWKRIPRYQITAEGGSGLFTSKIYSEIKIKFESPNKIPKFFAFSKLFSGSKHKRASQRWLFLQIQKLFPHEEIVEDYFHSEISRISGSNVQFDIFMIERNIAIEYHGKHHYEDIPFGFANVETYKNRDFEKEKICSEHGIQLIVIPYWWDNKLDSLRSFLYSKINL